MSKAYDDAEAAYQAAKKEDPKIVEARKPYEAAGEALAKALKALPQAEAAKAADKAYDDARHATPEYEARKAAQKALNDDRAPEDTGSPADWQ